MKESRSAEDDVSLLNISTGVHFEGLFQNHPATQSQDEIIPAKSRDCASCISPSCFLITHAGYFSVNGSVI
jgi:hypothetical protein